MKVNWKQLAVDVILAYILDFFIVNAFLVGTMKEVRENPEIYFYSLIKIYMIFLFLVFLWRIFDSCFRNEMLYVNIKPQILSRLLSCYTTKVLDEIEITSIKQGDKVEVVLQNGSEYIGVIDKYVLIKNNNKLPQVSFLLNLERRLNIQCDHIHIFYDDLKSINKIN